MARASDTLWTDGLAALARGLPAGYVAAQASLPRPPAGTCHWLLLRHRHGKAVTCRAVLRLRVESRDVPAIVRRARAAHVPTLVLAGLLSRSARALLQAAGIGAWDLTGNVHLDFPILGLRVERTVEAVAVKPKRPGLRSLGGELAGRVARALIDLGPPYSPAELATQARVDRACVSRLVAFLADAGLLTRAGRGRIETVAWRPLLERWVADAPVQARGKRFGFRAAVAAPTFLPRLARSGLLHALTGSSAFALLATPDAPAKSYVYVEDVPAAAAQLGLRATATDPDVVLIEPADRSVFHRSCEQRGLRYVSPSLMAADSEDRAAFATAVQWLAAHESDWRR